MESEISFSRNWSSFLLRVPEIGSRPIAPKKNCPPTPKLTPSQTLTLAAGAIFLGGNCLVASNTKTDPDLDPNPNLNRGQLSGYPWNWFHNEFLLKGLGEDRSNHLWQYINRSSPPDMFLGKGVPKICSKIPTLLKSHFDTSVFLQICYIFSEHLFLGKPLEGYFCIKLKLKLKYLLVENSDKMENK